MVKEELPVIRAVLESEDNLTVRRLFGWALARAIAQTKMQLAQYQRGSESLRESIYANVPREPPTCGWLPSEDQFPAMLFARSICGTQVDNKTLERAKLECIEACGISPWDPPMEYVDNEWLTGTIETRVRV